MLISAVIPAYNAELYLPAAIESLVRQTDPPLEIIVIDDCSSDHTGELTKRLAARLGIAIRLYQQPRNLGPAAARNLGVSEARGDWILFMDHDDILEPELVEMECRRIHDLQKSWQAKVVAAYSSYRIIDGEGKLLPGILSSQQLQPEETLGYEFVHNQISANSGLLVNKEAFWQAGGFNPKYRLCEGYDLYLRLAQIGGGGLMWMFRWCG